MNYFILAVILISVYIYLNIQKEYNKLPEEHSLLLVDKEKQELKIYLEFAHKYADWQIIEVIVQKMKKFKSWDKYVVRINQKKVNLFKNQSLKNALMRALNEYRKEEILKSKEYMDFNIKLNDTNLNNYEYIVNQYIKILWLKYGNVYNYRKLMKKALLNMYDSGNLSKSLHGKILKSMYQFII